MRSKNPKIMSEPQIQTAVPITDYAIILDPRDNVAVVKTETASGLCLVLMSGKLLEIKDTIPP